MKAKLEESKARKDEKDLKAKERELAAIDAIIDYHGTIVTNKEELDALFNGPNALNRLKDQIRFRSVVRKERILMTGNKLTLYNRLLNHLSDSNSASTSK